MCSPYTGASSLNYEDYYPTYSPKPRVSISDNYMYEAEKFRIANQYKG
jgi:hypothetical protein